MKKFLLLMCLLLVVITACKKDVQPDPPTQYMPQELKDYMLFKKNSYWVYQDSATGALDSTVVTHDSTYIHKYWDDEINAYAAIYERYSVDTYSFLSANEYNYLTGLRCMYQGFTSQDYCYFITRRLRNSSIHQDMGSTRIFFFQPISGTSVNSGFNTVTVAAKYDSLQVGGSYYHSVVRMDDTANFTEGGWPTRFYIARHYGIIRKEILRLTGRQVWNLVRSELLQ